MMGVAGEAGALAEVSMEGFGLLFYLCESAVTLPVVEKHSLVP
jgi:hypothetical protein